MSRLPVVSSDGNAWGTILNDFLSQAHNADGSIKNLFYNVKDPAYGAKGDGSTDDTAAISAARAAARATGGGIIFYPPGTYISGNQDISTDAFISHRGSGIDATIIKLTNGANTDLFSGQTGSINLAASPGAGSAGTLYNFGFFDLTLDGNKANQTAGPSWPLRFYGYDYILQNLEVRNGYSGNILSDWNAGNTFANESMESRITNVKTHDSGGIGFCFSGPHDSQFVNMICFNEASHCLQIAPNAGGATFTHVHNWNSGLSPVITKIGTDTFVRTNQSGLGTASDTQVWAEIPASTNVTAAIASNQATFTGNGSELDSVFTLGSTSALNIDITARVNLGSDAANNNLGLAFHVTDINNYYRATISNNVLHLRKIVGGSGADITTAGFTLVANAYAYMRVQMTGTAIKVKMWLDGANGDAAPWLINTTDAALGTGKYGIAAWINSGTALVDHLSAVVPSAGDVPFLVEANNVHFDNCTADTAPSGVCGVALLASNCDWIGGRTEFVATIPAHAFQLGQLAGQAPYPNQVYQASGLTSPAIGAQANRINTTMINASGGQGALFFANDGGNNKIDVTHYTTVTGTNRSGTVAASTELHILSSGVIAGTDEHIFAPGAMTFQNNITTSGLLAVGQSATAVALAASGTIATANIGSSRVAPTGNVASIILAAGTVPGQEVTVVNESAFTVTMAASGTSHVADGVSCVIAANRKMDFTWDSGTSLWYHS